MRSQAVLAILAVWSTAASAQDTPLNPFVAPRMAENGLVIRRHVESLQPFTVAGPRGVILGQQEGTFEAWILPVKLLSHFTIRAEAEGYSVPIDLNPDAAEIEVYPDRTTITYSHIAFTVRQTMFAPERTPDGTGAVVLFEIDSTRPLDLTFSFTPEMRPMWPEPSQGTPSPEWVKNPGFYILHTDFPSFSGAVTIPGAQPGILAPYQEKPQVHPLELKLHFDPKRDIHKAFPLLMAVGKTAETASNAALQNSLTLLNDSLPEIYKAHAAAYDQMQKTLTSIHTPDTPFNDAFQWAEVSIEQLRARTLSEPETSLVAGYFSSGDSARPGFGWYFGRDTLFTLYAVNGMGDFALSRQALEFLIKRQREDGKMMHEYSQTAASVDWKAFPYLYASADATPLFLTTMLDYVLASGDVEFLMKHKDAVARAWAFETSHDTDGDGIYDNSQGTGWVESWPGGMPHQEIYLASLDQQASTAMSRLAALIGDTSAQAQAATRATKIQATLEAEYFRAGQQAYAFSRNADGSLDTAATIYPAIAWWNGGTGLEHAQASFARWASHDFSTDWGLRDVAESDPVYDPISYHQGSVWPLFTGWASIAEYRSGHPLAGYTHLMQNADQTTSQDLGSVTELLSGAFFQPFGRSTSHQLWSSAMVITPALRGMFGIQMDAPTHTIHLSPHLPAEWPTAEVRQLHLGASIFTLAYTRNAGRMNVRLQDLSGPPVKLASEVPGAKETSGSLSFPLPAVEVAVSHGLPPRGSRTVQMKVLTQTETARSLTLEVEGQAGSTSDLLVRQNGRNLQLTVTGGTLGAVRPDGLKTLSVAFPDGVGYRKQTVSFSW